MKIVFDVAGLTYLSLDLARPMSGDQSAQSSLGRLPTIPRGLLVLSEAGSS